MAGHPVKTLWNAVGVLPCLASSFGGIYNIRTLQSDRKRRDAQKVSTDELEGGGSLEPRRSNESRERGAGRREDKAYRAETQ
jgi:hypothetical protein